MGGRVGWPIANVLHWRGNVTRAFFCLLGSGDYGSPLAGTMGRILMFRY